MDQRQWEAVTILGLEIKAGAGEAQGMAVARGTLVKKKAEVTIRRQCETGGEEDEMSKLSAFPFGSY